MSEKLTASELKKLRESEFYKFNNVSDFKTVRKCKEVAKELYECLKYFDSRSSRFIPVFDSYNNKIYKVKRSRVAPADYYSFKFLSVDISIYRKGDEYFVGTQGFRSWTFPSVYNSDTFFKYSPTKVFTEALTSFCKIIAEFLDRYFQGEKFGL